jgi:epsilon-lactone hydrolase
VPDHFVPVPDTVSPQMQAIIAQPYNPNWNVVPKSPAEWKAIVDKAADAVVATLPEIRHALGVTVQPTTIAGVKAGHAKGDSTPQSRPHSGACAWRRLRA